MGEWNLLVLKASTQAQEQGSCDHSQGADDKCSAQMTNVNVDVPFPSMETVKHGPVFGHMHQCDTLPTALR